MLVFQGEQYLRLFHCDPQEISHDIVQEYAQVELSLLHDQYHQRTAKSMKDWDYLDTEYREIDQVLSLSI